MKLSGQATVNATVDQVYAALIDPAMLVRTIPGCQRLEQVGGDAYRATIVAGVASIKGTFDGDVRLTDQAAPHSFTLHASGVGAPGTVTAVARVTLTAADATSTRLNYDADATIGGVIGGVGQRMISGVARRTAAEFFSAVDRELTRTTPPGPTAVPAGQGVAAAVHRAAEPHLALPSTEHLALPPAEAHVALPSAEPAASGGVPGVWTAPAPVVDPSRQRIRDLMVGAAFGAVIALLGVLVGAIVAGW